MKTDDNAIESSRSSNFELETIFPNAEETAIESSTSLRRHRLQIQIPSVSNFGIKSEEKGIFSENATKDTNTVQRIDTTASLLDDFTYPSFKAVHIDHFQKFGLDTLIGMYFSPLITVFIYFYLYLYL